MVTRAIETGWSFGAVASATYHLQPNDTTLRTSNLQLIGLYSQQRQFVAVLNGTTFFPGKKYILNYLSTFSRFPDRFWGIGKNALQSAEEPYTFKQFQVFVHVQKNLGQNVYLGWLYQYQKLIHVDYLSGGLFDRQDVAGRYGYHISGTGPSLTLDTRDHSFTPHKGYFLQFLVGVYGPFTGSQFKFTNYTLDLRNYHSMSKRIVLASQVFGFFNAGQVPFRSMASFGGAGSMRGYYDGRYRDRHQIVVQEEFRLPIKGRLGIVIFGDAGDVGRDLGDFSIREIKFTAGGGLRFALNKKERLNLRLDYGIGKAHNQGIYFQLGEAF